MWQSRVDQPRQCPQCKSTSWATKRGKPAQWAAARKIAAKHFGENEIKGKIVHHKDGNPWNNEISNLEVLTAEEHRKKHRDLKPSAPCEEIIIRNVPESIRARLKANAALEGKSMQGLVLELITKYVWAQQSK
jgi:hypothetical protein